MRASAACRLPTCLCSRPERARMKTSNSGQSLLMGRPLGSWTRDVGDGAWLCAAAAVLGRVSGSRFANPTSVLVGGAPRLQPLLITGTLALQHSLELAPINGAGEIVLRGLIPSQGRVRDLEPEELRLRHRDVDEFLPQLIVGEALDPPTHRLRRMSGARIARPEHHDRRPPPPVERILRHRALLGSAARQREHDLEALALMEALLLADAHHGARVRAIGTAADRDLVHDGRAVDQPADRPDIRPGECRIVEDARVLGAAVEQLLQHLRPRDAERLGGAVEIHAVAALVLHLGDEYGLAPQRRRARDPVALGQHADDLRVRMLGDLSDQRLPVCLRHPVLGLDLLVTLDALLEAALQGRLPHRASRPGIGNRGVQRLSVHGSIAAASQRDPGISYHGPFLCHVLSCQNTAVSPLAKPLEALLRRFQSQRPLRGGSLLITLFGDAIAPRGGAVTLGSLIDLAQPFGLAERLVRTSVGRLAAEGWLAATRHGRRSEYRLTENGRKLFAEATRRIYGVNPSTWSAQWTLAVVPAGNRRNIREELRWLGFGQLSPGVYAHPACTLEEARGW